MNVRTWHCAIGLEFQIPNILNPHCNCNGLQFGHGHAWREYIAKLSNCELFIFEFLASQIVHFFSSIYFRQYSDFLFITIFITKSISSNKVQLVFTNSLICGLFYFLCIFCVEGSYEALKQFEKEPYFL